MDCLLRLVSTVCKSMRISMVHLILSMRVSRYHKRTLQNDSITMLCLHTHGVCEKVENHIFFKTHSLHTMFLKQNMFANTQNATPPQTCYSPRDSRSHNFSLFYFANILHFTQSLATRIITR